MGIAGLSRIIAMEGAAKNVRCNCIAPVAWTRMTQSGPIKDEAQAARRAQMAKDIRPDQPARFSVALISEAAKNVTGQIFAVRMNEIFLMGQSRPLRSIHRDGGWTVETIAEHGMPALKSSFYELDRSADIFNWDAV